MSNTIDPAIVLNRLGSTKEDVADTIAAAGVVGLLKEARGCALGNYLELQGYTKPSVFPSVEPATEEEVLVVLVDGWAGVVAPQPVAEFVAAYDRGAFADLVDA